MRSDIFIKSINAARVQDQNYERSRVQSNIKLQMNGDD